MAEIFALTTVPTAEVVTVNVADVAPDGINTLAGTTALAEFDCSVTVSPPVGAGPSRVIVAVLVVPPITVVGVNDKPLSTPGFTVSVPLADLAPTDPVIVTVVMEATGAVVTVNVIELDPAGTVTEVGTVTLELSDDKFTTVPPVGAEPVRVTVAVDEVPPVTAVGAKLRVDGTGAVTERVPVAEEPAVAVIVAVESDPSGVVVAVKVEVVAPAVTITEFGTVTPFKLEDKAT